MMVTLRHVCALARILGPKKTPEGCSEFTWAYGPPIDLTVKLERPYGNVSAIVHSQPLTLQVKNCRDTHSTTE